MILPISLLNAFGLFFHATPIRYTGIPVNVMRQPIPVSLGAANSEATSRKTQARPNTIGMAILNYKNRMIGILIMNNISN